MDVIAGKELLAAAPGPPSTMRGPEEASARADEEEAILITVISKCSGRL